MKSADKQPSPELTFISDGVPFARLCIGITFYWHGSMFAQAARLADAYRRALAEVQDKIVYYESGEMSGAKRLNSDALGKVPSWLQRAKRREDIYLMHLKGGASPNEPSDVGVEFMADEEESPPIGALNLSLPAEYGDRPKALVKVARDIAESADFDSGHCGFSVAWDPRGDGATDAVLRMRNLSGRFLGIDLPKLNTTISAMRKSDTSRIKTVQWLTFLGAPVMQRMGREPAIVKTLNASCTAVEVGGGVLIQAGSRPTLGDEKRSSDVSALRSVGRALSAVRLTNHGPIFGTRDETGQWLARFDSPDAPAP